MGRIVVGADGSETAGSALAWAVEEAKIRGAETTVDVVMAWHEPIAGGTLPVAVYIDPAELKASYRAELDRTVEQARSSNPEVAIRGLLVQDAAARALLDAGNEADLLVLGSRGRGGFLGLLLGSVSHQVVSHSPCPVVAVPHRAST